MPLRGSSAGLTRRLDRLEQAGVPAGACWRCGGRHAGDLATITRVVRWAVDGGRDDGPVLCHCDDCARGCGALWRGLTDALAHG